MLNTFQYIKTDKMYFKLKDGVSQFHMPSWKVEAYINYTAPEYVHWNWETVEVDPDPDYTMTIQIQGMYEGWNVTLHTDGTNATIRFKKGNETRKFKYSGNIATRKIKDMVDYIPFRARIDKD